MTDTDSNVGGSSNIYEWLGRLSAAGLLASALITGQMGVWVWGSAYAEVKADRDEWKRLALAGSHLAVTAANQTIQGLREPTPLPPSNTNKDDLRVFLGRLQEKIRPQSEPES